MANEQDKQLDQWNDAWRMSPQYSSILMSVGVDPSKPFKLSDAQRKMVQSQLEDIAGQPFEKGMEIDPAGNMNQNEGFGKQVKRWGPLAGGIALTLFGIPGVMPGLLTSGGAAAPVAASTATGSATAPLASYGPSAAIQAANMGMAGLPSVAASASGAVPGVVSAVGGAGGGMGLLDKFLAPFKSNPLGTLLSAGGRMAGAAAETAAGNRGTKLDATMEANKINQQAYRDWYNQMVEREQEGRTGRNDSWKALQQGEYISNWKPSGQQFSPYTRALTAPSDAVREAGAARAADARTRLTGYSLPTPERQTYELDPALLNGSIWEKLGGIVGAGAEVAGGMMGDNGFIAEARRRGIPIYT